MGIDPVPVAPPAVGVRAEVRAKKPATSSPCGLPDGGGFIAFYKWKPTTLFKEKSPHTPQEQPVESVGIPDLAADGD